MSVTLFENKPDIVSRLMAAEAELIIVIEEEEDNEAAAELWGVVEKIQEIIFRLRLQN
jgi:hypothetical protein